MFIVSPRPVFVAILTFASVLSISAMASKTTVGDGNYSQEGCSNTLENMLGNLPEGYVVTPKMTWNNTVWICANLNYSGPQMVDNVEKLAVDVKDCMNIKVNREKKTVEIQFLPAMKQVIQLQTKTTQYLLAGQPVDQVKENEQRAIKFCIIDPSLLEEPYSKFLK
jgi:hypothetical protein